MERHFRVKRHIKSDTEKDTWSTGREGVWGKSKELAICEKIVFSTLEDDTRIMPKVYNLSMK